MRPLWWAVPNYVALEQNTREGLHMPVGDCTCPWEITATTAAATPTPAPTATNSANSTTATFPSHYATVHLGANLLEANQNYLLLRQLWEPLGTIASPLLLGLSQSHTQKVTGNIDLTNLGVQRRPYQAPIYMVYQSRNTAKWLLKLSGKGSVTPWASGPANLSTRMYMHIFIHLEM